MKTETKRKTSLKLIEVDRFELNVSSPGMRMGTIREQIHRGNVKKIKTAHINSREQKLTPTNLELR